LNPSVHIKHINALRQQARALKLSAADTLKYIGMDYMARTPMAERTWLIRMDGYTIPLRSNGTDARILSEVFGDVYRYDSQLPVRRILDLGANIGLSALYFHGAHPDATIACVEASPKNAALLARTVSLNRLPAKVIEAAIGTDNGAVTFWDTKDPSCCTLIQDQRATAASQITVAQLTVQSVMNRMGWDALDLVKIDIEGYERFLLRQDVEWLGKTAAIVGEIHEGYTFDDLSCDLHSFGFAVTERSRNEVHGMVNFVAVKNDPTASKPAR
jgi:FkbM family methyltransferase